MANGSGGWDGGTRGIPRDGQQCLDVYKFIQIFSPDESVLRKVKIGDELLFDLVIKAGKPTLHVVFVDETAGSIVHPELTNCIQEGNQYKAIIVSIEDGLYHIDAEKIIS